MTLRQKKKERTRNQIVAAAAARFTRHGFRTTTMEEIASAAQVSVGTLYNYFGSKGSLLLAIIGAETGHALRQGEAVIADPGPDPEAAVVRLFDAFLGGLLHLDRQIIGEALHESFGGAGFADTELGREFVSLDLQFMDQTGRLLAHYRRLGRLPEAVPIEEAVLLLYSVCVTQLLLYVGIAGMTPDAVGQSVRRQVAAAFTGLTLRNETEEA